MKIIIGQDPYSARQRNYCAYKISVPNNDFPKYNEVIQGNNLNAIRTAVAFVPLFIQPINPCSIISYRRVLSVCVGAEMAVEMLIEVRKLTNILLYDIVGNRDSRVHTEFSEYLTTDDEKIITEPFTGKENSPDDDINLSPDQTEVLSETVRQLLHYPKIRVDDRANYLELREFLGRLLEIFKWDIYERDTLGFFNEDKQQYTKLRHYAFV